MNVILTGCEYSVMTTLAGAISGWAISVMGGEFGFHDHWKIPHVGHPPGPTEEEQELFLALTPAQKEAFQRYHMGYHLSDSFYSYLHHNVVGMHIDDAVYAGLYYGYGGDGQYADRKVMARHVEEQILRRAPQSVHILVKAEPDVIRARMKEDPHHNGLLQDKDVEHVLQRFAEEYERSLINNKVVIDKSAAAVE